MDQRNELVIADCSKCRATVSREQRQALGCGYEPPIDRVRLTMWQPPSGQHGYRGEDPTVCAGYSTALPEVREVQIVKFYADSGNLATWLRGETPTDELLYALVIYASACNAVQHWTMTPQKDGGGGA